MSKCAVKDCIYDQRWKIKGVGMHTFPTDERMRDRWIESIGSHNLLFPLVNRKICSLHFEDKFVDRSLDFCTTLIKSSDSCVPTMVVNEKYQELVSQARKDYLSTKKRSKSVSDLSRLDDSKRGRPGRPRLVKEQEGQRYIPVLIDEYFQEFTEEELESIETIAG